MFGSLRLNRRKAAVYIFLAVLMLIGLLLLLLRPGAADTVSIAGESYPLAADSVGDVEAFITACGYEPARCIGDRVITVPRTWNGVYTSYNDLQREQGLDLTPYRGCEAREQIYELSGTGDRAAVLISGGRIIAAHLSTMKYGDKNRPLINKEPS